MNCRQRGLLEVRRHAASSAVTNKMRASAALSHGAVSAIDLDLSVGIGHREPTPGWSHGSTDSTAVLSPHGIASSTAASQKREGV